MAKFLKRIFFFFSIPVTLILVLSFAVPPTPRAQTSLLFSKIDKDHLLATIPPPRLILIGGSNLSYGLDCSLIEQDLNIHPIDTAIHVNLGAKYMLEASLPYIRSGDIVLIALEYQQFYGSKIWGGEELLRMVMDVDRSSLKTLNLRQWLAIARYFPEYAVSKIKPSEYNYKKDPYIGIYERGSFNAYGDAYIHWSSELSGFTPFSEVSGSFDDEVIELLQSYQDALHQKGAELYITYPVLQATSFRNIEPWIREVEWKLTTSGLNLLGSPERYKLDDQYFHDTPYHLSREGVVLRTGLVIEDLRPVLNQTAR